MGIEKSLKAEPQVKTDFHSFNPDKRIENSPTPVDKRFEGGEHLGGVGLEKNKESFVVDNRHNGESYNPDKRIEMEQKSGNIDVGRYDPDKRIESGEKYYTSYDERLQQVPSGRGEWTAERGESKFVPDNEMVRAKLEEYGINGIEYKNAIPDFSPVAKETVRIDMTSDRGKNFAQCDSKCADKWNRENHDGRNNWTAREVKKWRQENEHSWHEGSDMETCQLVPRVIHNECTHMGSG